MKHEKCLKLNVHGHMTVAVCMCRRGRGGVVGGIWYLNIVFNNLRKETE